MKILLTGANGMVGKNILEHPMAAQYDFLLPLRSELDLLDYKSVSDYMALHKPDLVIHAAGHVGGIQANIANPVLFLVNNLDIGRNTIMAAKNNNITKLINLASSCIYPRFAVNPLSEDLILTGELEPTNEGYALAKIVSTRLCEYITAEDANFKYKTVIPSNLYGRYDKFSPEHSHMVPAVIKKVAAAKEANQKELDIWGDGLARREFMYAGDLADFIFYAIPRFDDMPQNINVGLGFDYSINEYYKAIAKVIGFDGKFINDLSKPIGMKQKLIDDTRLQQFGWKHKTSLEEGLRKTYDYYKTTQDD